MLVEQSTQRKEVTMVTETVYNPSFGILKWCKIAGYVVLILATIVGKTGFL
jgi:hypothetical protein